MCVHLQFQRCGIGRLLIEYGLAKVDDLGLESFIEATSTGQSLYAQYGYRPIMSLNVDMDHADASK